MKQRGRGSVLIVRTAYGAPIEELVMATRSEARRQKRRLRNVGKGKASVWLQDERFCAGARAEIPRAYSADLGHPCLVADALDWHCASVSKIPS